MVSSVAEVCAVIERLWPRSGAESWDAPGIISGALTSHVSSILLAVDAVDDTVSEALALESDLLLVHHPLLMRGVNSVAEDRYKGELLARLIRGDCALIAAHTNADVVESGTSAVIAEKLGLINIAPITKSAIEGEGLGRVGELKVQTTLGVLARRLAEILPATATGVRCAGEYDQVVRSVALCGGAGDSLLQDPAVTGADVYISSDLRHHPASEAREQARLTGKPAIIDVSHWASEWLWLETAAEQLRAALPSIVVSVSDLRTDPWDFAIVQ